MAEPTPSRAHLITGGFPPGAMSGHDHDYARLRLLGLLAERNIPASVANDFSDIAKWLPTCQLLITYVAGPYPDAAQTEEIRQWLEAGGHWLALHGTSGGKAERVEGTRMRAPSRPRAATVPRRSALEPPVQFVPQNMSPKHGLSGPTCHQFALILINNGPINGRNSLPLHAAEFIGSSRLRSLSSRALTEHRPTTLADG